MDVFVQPVTIPPAASSRLNVKRTSPLSRTSPGLSEGKGNAWLPTVAGAPWSNTCTSGAGAAARRGASAVRARSKTPQERKEECMGEGG